MVGSSFYWREKLLLPWYNKRSFSKNKPLSCFVFMYVCVCNIIKSEHFIQITGLLNITLLPQIQIHKCHKKDMLVFYNLACNIKCNFLMCSMFFDLRLQFSPLTMTSLARFASFIQVVIWWCHGSAHWMGFSSALILLTPRSCSETSLQEEMIPFSVISPV